MQHHEEIKRLCYALIEKPDDLGLARDLVSLFVRIHSDKLNIMANPFSAIQESFNNMMKAIKGGHLSYQNIRDSGDPLINDGTFLSSPPTNNFHIEFNPYYPEHIRGLGFGDESIVDTFRPSLDTILSREKPDISNGYAYINYLISTFRDYNEMHTDPSLSSNISKYLRAAHLLKMFLFSKKSYHEIEPRTHAISKLPKNRDMFVFQTMLKNHMEGFAKWVIHYFVHFRAPVNYLPCVDNFDYYRTNGSFTEEDVNLGETCYTSLMLINDNLKYAPDTIYSKPSEMMDYLISRLTEWLISPDTIQYFYMYNRLSL